MNPQQTCIERDCFLLSSSVDAGNYQIWRPLFIRRILCKCWCMSLLSKGNVLKYWSKHLIFLVWTTRFIIDLHLILHHNLKYPIIYWISESLGKWRQSSYFAFSWCYHLILKFHMWCMLESGRPPTVAGWTLALEKMVHNPPKNSKHNPA